MGDVGIMGLYVLNTCIKCRWGAIALQEHYRVKCRTDLKSENTTDIPYSLITLTDVKPIKTSSIHYWLFNESEV